MTSDQIVELPTFKQVASAPKYPKGKVTYSITAVVEEKLLICGGKKCFGRMKVFMHAHLLKQDKEKI